MFKTNKNNQIIFKPGKLVSKTCVIVPSQKLKMQIIWSQRYAVLSCLSSLIIGALLNSWLVILALWMGGVFIETMYMKKLILSFESTTEKISIIDYLNDALVKPCFAPQNKKWVRFLEAMSTMFCFYAAIVTLYFLSFTLYTFRLSNTLYAVS